MSAPWLGLVMFAVGWAAGFGGYWLAEKLSPVSHEHCRRCGARVPPGVELCWECSEETGR